MPLTIPDYQRPYKWREQHVNQLLEDIITHRNKKCYRLGTVVLHQDNDCVDNQLSIVDGQQRLLTLTLLCSLLDKSELCSPKLLECTFSSLTTIRNLQHNAAVIESRIKQLSEIDREELMVFLLHKCELISIRLDDLSEAFQFFDSQNARGKELEPYDLLKAFHLREMEDNTEQQRTQCVAAWEAEVSPENKNTPSLHAIMSDYLFPIRRWSQGHTGAYFGRKNIHVFKGVNLNVSSYRYAESLRALNYMVDQYNVDNIRHLDRQLMLYPFQIDQTMLNGKRFFEYIQHYIDVYQSLFINEKLELKALMEVIDSSKGRKRDGDRYVKKLFFCALLYYYDKFGDVELKKAARICFLWSYRLRLTLYSVRVESVDNLAKHPDGLFSAIKQALHPHEVLAYMVQPVQKSQTNGTNIDEILAKFNVLGYMQNDH